MVHINEQNSKLINSQQNKDIFKGFIIADAHIGWDNKVQPSVSEQEDLIRVILKRFPDLDAFLDAGDAYHNLYSGEGARTDYTKAIINQIDKIPFFLSTGNHEIQSTNSTKLEPQDVVNKVGSNPVYPWHSATVKNIHFIFLPQYGHVSFVSPQCFDWLRMDLEVNKDKTTIILAHNNLKGTTTVEEIFYRRMANSDEIHDLLNHYPNVIAWVHGHNHTFEVVKKNDKFFISAGRFGGFSNAAMRRFATDHLGGIYFEISKNQVVFRSYSATSDKFMDELEMPYLSGTMQIETSVDANAIPEISYGGAARNGLKVPIYNHYWSESSIQDLYLKSSESGYLNEAPYFQYLLWRVLSEKYTFKVPGFNIDELNNKKPRGWQWLDPGIRLQNSTYSIDFPAGPGSQSQYRVIPEEKLTLIFDISSYGATGTITLKSIIYDNNLNALYEFEKKQVSIEDGEQVKEVEYQIPSFSNMPSIYSDVNISSCFIIQFDTEFNIEDNWVRVNKIAIIPSGANETGATLKLTVRINNGKWNLYNSELAPDQIARMGMPFKNNGMSVLEFKADNNKNFVWLIREKGLMWQVRNATVKQESGYLDIGPIRNEYSPNQEIVIAPMYAVNYPYVVKTTGINKVTIYQYNESDNKLMLDVKELINKSSSNKATVTIYTQQKPIEIKGAKSWVQSEQYLVLEIDKEGTLEVKFSR